jgi:hypothetical protein
MAGDITTCEHHSDPTHDSTNLFKTSFDSQILVVFVVLFRVVIRSEPNLKV